MVSGLKQQVAVDSACHVGVTALVAVAEVVVPPAIDQIIAEVIGTTTVSICLTIPTHLLVYWCGLEGIVAEGEDAVVVDPGKGVA